MGKHNKGTKKRKGEKIIEKYLGQGEEDLCTGIGRKGEKKMDKGETEEKEGKIDWAREKKKKKLGKL